MPPSRRTQGKETHPSRLRKRVDKACDRCRMKKARCNGDQPCAKCKEANSLCHFSARKPYQNRVHPQGYVELLEQQQRFLVAGLRIMYKRLQAVRALTGSSLPGDDVEPQTHDILTALQVINDDSKYEEGIQQLDQDTQRSPSASSQEPLDSHNTCIPNAVESGQDLDHALYTVQSPASESALTTSNTDPTSIADILHPQSDHSMDAPEESVSNPQAFRTGPFDATQMFIARQSLIPPQQSLCGIVDGPKDKTLLQSPQTYDCQRSDSFELARCEAKPMSIYPSPESMQSSFSSTASSTAAPFDSGTHNHFSAAYGTFASYREAWPFSCLSAEQPYLKMVGGSYKDTEQLSTAPDAMYVHSNMACN